MTEPHVVTGLMTKRAELAGMLEHHQAKVRQLVIDLDAIDQVLRLFKPDIELDAIKPKPMPPRYAAVQGRGGEDRPGDAGRRQTRLHDAGANHACHGRARDEHR